MHLLLAAALLATPPILVAQGTPVDTSPPAQAAEPAPASAPTALVTPVPAPAPEGRVPSAVEQPSAGKPSDGLKLLGLQLGAGVPQGGALSAVVRPVKWVRGTVGLSHNVLGLGVQGSVTAIPFHFAVTPTLTLEAGRFFKTDASSKVSGTFPDALDPALRSFGYDFYSAQIGLEFGSQRSFLFFLRGGLAWVKSGLADVRDYRPDGSTTTTVDVDHPTVSATIPTVNLGFLVYVW